MTSLHTCIIDDGRTPAGAGRQDTYLQPGAYFVGGAPHRVRTLLGSCVSITMWNRERRIGAMSHFLLAARPARGAGTACLDGRYGDEALRLMLEELALYGIGPADCEAKIFGGGHMFPGMKTKGAFDIGRRNGETARALLQGLGARVVSENLFGNGHRYLVFDIASGHVWLRRAHEGIEPAPRQGVAAWQRPRGSDGGIPEVCRGPSAPEQQPVVK